MNDSDKNIREKIHKKIHIIKCKHRKKTAQDKVPWVNQSLKDMWDSTA